MSSGISPIQSSSMLTTHSAQHRNEIQNAKLLLTAGKDVNYVSDATGLSQEKVAALQFHILLAQK